MPSLNWSVIQDGGVFESLMHAILYADDPQTVLFGRPGRDAGQDARTADSSVVFQAKYREGLDMDGAVNLALEELDKIKKYRAPNHANYEHWKNAKQWILFANLLINPTDYAKWISKVVPEFKKEGLAADYWDKAGIEGKLNKMPEIRDVFFGQENRVFVGLKEAHDLLRTERLGSDSLNTPIIGRDAELNLVNDFANSPDKRVLPIVGSGGIGKSRFLYESLVALSQLGWRILWALPETMTKSPQWFRLLNGTQKTCVALDDPEDSGLLRAAIEQLATVERRNWRVIVSCRSDRSETLQKYKTNKIVESPIRLSNLKESNSQDLLKRLGASNDDAWLHKVHHLTRGNPGWLCLIAELAKHNKLHELPQKSDDIATLYVKSCLNELDNLSRHRAHILLRWLSLWRVVVIEKGNDDREDIAFLENEGIPKNELRPLLKQLVQSGLVRNWGVEKRVFGVDSIIIRQHILSEWLLEENAGATYSVSNDGATLVRRLISDRLPRLDATLLTISQLSFSRLDSEEANTLLRPIFSEMIATAERASLIQQNHLIGLVAKLGIADPEGALDVLIAIRANMKSDEEIQDSFWGKQVFTQGDLLTSLSWTLFNVAENVNDANVARRFLLEFRELFKLVDSGLKADELGGKSPQRLLGRLLNESRQSGLFARPAYELAAEHLQSDDWWPFVGSLANFIMEPVRQSMEWVANSALRIKRYAVAPESPEWDYLLDLRAKLFKILEQSHPGDLYNRIWTLLAESHRSISGTAARVRVPIDWEPKYREISAKDLKQSALILKSGRSFAEATRARPIWDWYLEYGKDSELATLARECEKIYSGSSKWRMHDFFRFDYTEELQKETTRIVELLREDPNPAVYQEFFDEAERYLKSVRNGRDLADDWRFSDLAAALAVDFSLEERDNINTLSAFVLSILEKSDKGKRNTYFFAVSVCRIRLGHLKKIDKFIASKWLTRLLTNITDTPSLLFEIYANAHPASVGSITQDEVQYIFLYKNDFSDREWLWLLGVLVATADETLSTQVNSPLKSLKGTYEASLCLNAFIKASCTMFLQYKRTPSQDLVKSIVGWISEFGLDGALLVSHDLETLVTNSGFTPTMRLFTSLMKSRVELEGKPKPVERFQILPYHFNVKIWFRFDPASAEDISAFSELCELALGVNFTATYWLPKYLAVIDSSGEHVASFVNSYFEKNPNPNAIEVSRLSYLASEYPADSKAWADIASPICAKTRDMTRENRERVYFGLSRKETEVMTSAPGEVASGYTDAVSEARTLLQGEPADSPLHPYRIWALRRAELDLQREAAFVEEIGDE